LLKMKYEEMLLPLLHLNCPSCIPNLEHRVKLVPGVKEAKGDFKKKTIKVKWDPASGKIEDIEAAVEKLGYLIKNKKYPGSEGPFQGLFGSENKSNFTEITDKEFSKKVLKAKEAVAVMFGSKFCLGCISLKADFVNVAERFANQYSFYEMDINETETFRNYDIMSVPTIVLFRDGKPAEKFVAAMTVDNLENVLARG
jgi:thioredoxin 1